MTTNDRTEPGVCTRCGGTHLVSIGDGYSVNPCPNCAGQQPPKPARCKCGCVYATAKNTAAVRKGFSMGGYVKEFCAEHRPAGGGE